MVLETKPICGSPLTFSTRWFDFRQKRRFFCFSIYLQTEDTLFTFAANYVLVQIYKCGWIANPQQLNKANLSTQYLYNELRTFLNVEVLFNNVATTSEFFDKRCVIFSQPFKCTGVVLKSYRPHNRMLWPSIWFWLNFRTKQLLEEALIFPHQMHKFRFP